jgi:hypothetical protein
MHPEVTDMIRLANNARPITFLFMVYLFNCPTDFAVVNGLMRSMAKGLMPIAGIMQLQRLFYTSEHHFANFEFVLSDNPLICLIIVQIAMTKTNLFFKLLFCSYPHIYIDY